MARVSSRLRNNCIQHSTPARSVKRVPLAPIHKGPSAKPLSAGTQLRLAALQPNHALSRRSLLPASLSASLFPVLVPSRSVAAAATAAGEAEQVLEEPKWPAEFPFEDRHFQRFDESADGDFYAAPRFVTHIDDSAIAALRAFYDASFPKAPDERASTAVLDLCSSWISHYPKGFSAGRVAGLGMNEAELAKNEVLTESALVDLNTNPVLPYEDDSFDFITNAVSVDYLNKPLDVFREMHRVLKPGGKAIMSFSNRCFPTKAIALWTSTGDLDHIYVVGSYFHYSVPGGFTAPEGKEITLAKSRNGRGDPMYVVQACKV